MQMNNNHKNTIMRSKFATMSTAELKNLVKTDCMAAEDDQLDIDTIMYLLEVIDERDKLEEAPALDIDPASAQADFTATYLADHTPAQNSPTPIHTQRKRPSYGMRFLIAALVAVMACTVSASAFHLSIFQMFAEWTEDTFQFISSIVMSISANDEEDPLSDLRVIVTAKTPSPLVPYWCPDGFEATNTQEYALATKYIYKSTLVHDEDEIIITITYHIDGIDAYTYTSEKEALDAIEFECNGITHYITENTGITVAAWYTGDFVCEISGDITLDEAERMIESIL